MADVTLTIPDEHLPRVVTALCAAEGLDESPSNARRALMRQLRRLVESHEARTIRRQVDDDLDAQLAARRAELEAALDES